MALTITHCAFYDWGPAAIRITRGDTQSLSITHNVFWSIPGNAIDISTVTDDLDIAHNNFQAGVKTAISIDHAVGASALLINHNDFLTTGAPSFSKMSASLQFRTMSSSRTMSLTRTHIHTDRHFRRSVYLRQNKAAQ